MSEGSGALLIKMFFSLKIIPVFCFLNQQTLYPINVKILSRVDILKASTMAAISLLSLKTTNAIPVFLCSFPSSFSISDSIFSSQSLITFNLKSSPSKVSPFSQMQQHLRAGFGFKSISYQYASCSSILSSASFLSL